MLFLTLPFFFKNFRPFAANRTFFRRSITFVNITANCTYKFFHFFLLIFLMVLSNKFNRNCYNIPIFNILGCFFISPPFFRTFRVRCGSVARVIHNFRLDENGLPQKLVGVELKIVRNSIRLHDVFFVK